ncbi:MAG: hypothetical protein J6V24_11680 [Clostridia bacterium]|nr:hypothetical protein [Clostridia bacterium]
MNCKKVSRIAALLLAALMLGTACSEKPTAAAEGGTAAGTQDAQTAVENNASEANEPEAEEEYDPFADLPDTTWDGRSFHLLAREMYLYELWTEAMTGDAFNDAVYERNAAVEQRYDVKIEAIPIAGEWANRDTFITAVRSSIQANDGAYDLIDGYAATIGEGFGSGLYMNLREVPNLRLEKDWWSALLRDELTVNGRLFAITGDLAVNLWEQMQVIFFNKPLLTDFQLDSPYDMVLDGTWTYDAYLSMIAGHSLDADGDGTMTDADRYGALYYDQLTFDNLHNAFDVRLTKRGADGSVELDVFNEQIVKIGEMAYDLAYNNPDVYSLGGVVGDTREPCRQMFTEGKGLFFASVLEDAGLMRDMDADFGILPYPKWNESQSEYHTTSRDGRSMFTIPIDTPDAAFSGLIAEALCVEGNRRVIPVFYDKVLKGKNARDEQSGRMLDIIRAGLVLDFAAEYAVQTGRAGFIIRDSIAEQKDIASFYASKQKVFDVSFQKFLKAYYE